VTCRSQDVGWQVAGGCAAFARRPQRSASQPLPAPWRRPPPGPAPGTARVLLSRVRWRVHPACRTDPHPRHVAGVDLPLHRQSSPLWNEI